MPASKSFLITKNENNQFVPSDIPDTSSGTDYWFHTTRDDKFDTASDMGVTPGEYDALFSEITRPYFLAIDNNEFLLFLKAVNLNPNSDPEDMVSLRILCDGKRIITVMNRPIQAVREVRGLTESDSGNIQSACDILMHLIKNVIFKINKQVKKLIEKMEALEELEDKNSDISSEQIHDLRRTISRLSRFTSPQVDSLKKLSAAQLDWKNTSVQQELEDTVNQMSYLNEEIALLKERSEILNNELNSKINNKVNRNLYVISIISVIFLPLSFITGLLGINVGGIPGTDSDMGFSYVVIISIVICIFQIILLRIFRWF
ncbi:CorA family divalent cation transporter [Aliikangiella sp. G2MR2-5]|uniref:CorA family divalent cation transporter n=1 Tax=Aliikangiella sp. G2MR2-5 TaxID=2788943 RepID=UPI0018AC7BE2|nr:CorA family divalent cation transporter [Aliikangiella sp. G2MR2-5]